MLAYFSIVGPAWFFPDNSGVPVFAIVPTLWTAPLMLSGWIGDQRGAAATLALAVSLAVLLRARAGIWQTTLRSAWWWSLAALTAWWAAEQAASASSPGPLSPKLAAMQLAAVLLTLCPIVAVLGAKRPQATAWNFIVLSLYAIVALPVVEGLLLHPGRQVEMGDARGWFLWVLVLVGPINYLPTRHWLAVLLLAAGQVTALSPWLAGVGRAMVPEAAGVGLWLAAAALIVAWWGNRQRPVGSTSLDQPWRDFRDAYGMLWALRVQERMNAVAKQQGWGVELTWSGFCPQGKPEQGPAIDPAVEQAARTTLRSLLRRFVASAWLQEQARKERQATN